MSPIDFNPNNKPLDLPSKSEPSQGVAAAGQETANAAADKSSQTSKLVSDDKLVLSDALQALQKAARNLDAEAAHEQRLTELKMQIANGSLPITSEDAEVRKAAAMQVADKLVAFERQLSQALDEK